MARWYEDTRLIAEDRIRQVLDYEDLLSSRRHRYAESIATMLQKVSSPFRNASADKNGESPRKG
jgi:hypothetical protein